MPDCSECIFFNGSCCYFARNYQVATRWSEWPQDAQKVHVRTCAEGMFKKHLPNMAGHVLEVGAGVNQSVRKQLKWSRRCTVDLVDPRFDSSEKKRSHKATVGKLPFCDDLFDWVLCFECIEHWEEFGESIEQGIREIYRVLKSGGRFLASAPMFVHGSDPFVFGEAELIQQKIQTVPWSACYFEDWRRDYHPLPKLENWRTLGKERVEKLLGKYPEGPSCYKMEIFCTK